MIEQNRRNTSLDKFEENAQWMADNELLILAGYSNVGPGPLDYDEVTIDAVKQTCIKKIW